VTDVACAAVRSEAENQAKASAAAPEPAKHTSSGDVYTRGTADSWSRLFPETHVQSMSPLLLLYFPFGCFIAATRMVTWILLLALDTPLTDNDTTIALFRTLLGISVTWEGEEHLPHGKRHVLVSNHLTAGDLIVLYTRPQKYIHLITAALPERVTQVKNHRVVLRHATPAVYDRLAAGTDPEDSELPIHLFPEGGMTNGAGMLQFSRGFVRFSRDVPVVPMALRLSSPLAEISTHTLTSSFLANLFWFSFLPWMSFRCTVMEPMVMEDGESPGKFANRVQAAIAEELGVPISDITIQAKKKILKDALSIRKK